MRSLGPNDGRRRDDEQQSPSTMVLDNNACAYLFIMFETVEFTPRIGQELKWGFPDVVFFFLGVSTFGIMFCWGSFLGHLLLEPFKLAPDGIPS